MQVSNSLKDTPPGGLRVFRGQRPTAIGASGTGKK